MTITNERLKRLTKFSENFAKKEECLVVTEVDEMARELIAARKELLPALHAIAEFTGPENREALVKAFVMNGPRAIAPIDTMANRALAAYDAAVKE